MIYDSYPFVAEESDVLTGLSTGFLTKNVIKG